MYSQFRWKIHVFRWNDAHFLRFWKVCVVTVMKNKNTNRQYKHYKQRQRTSLSQLCDSSSQNMHLSCRSCPFVSCFHTDCLWVRIKWNQQSKIESNCGKKFVLSLRQTVFLSLSFLHETLICLWQTRMGQRLKITEQSSNARVQLRDSSSHFLYFVLMPSLH